MGDYRASLRVPAGRELPHLRYNSSLFQHVKLTEGSLQVGESFNGKRHPSRPTHITLVPVNESVTDDRVSALVGKKVTVGIKTDEVFWTRGQHLMAAGGTKGAFYCSCVLTDETVEALKKLRTDAGLPALPPPLTSASCPLDKDESLAQYHFRRSIGCIYPDFMDAIDNFTTAGDADKMQAIAADLEAWMADFSIHKNAFGLSGNTLVCNAQTNEAPRVTRTIQRQAPPTHSDLHKLLYEAAFQERNGP